MIDILDCTIRDGSYATHYYWEASVLKDIVSSLSEIGIRYIEIGNGTGLGAYRNIQGALDDESYYKNTIPYKNQSLIGAFFIPGTGTKEDLLKFKEFGGDFIRIGTNATQTENALEYVRYAKLIGLMVTCNLMKTYVISVYQLAYRCYDLVSAGVDYIYIVDSAGGMLPDQVARYFSAMKLLYGVKLGFHGHNNLMLANANSLIAANNGASLVDASLMCLGRGAGNAQTESLVAILQKSGLMDTSIQVSKLSDLSQRVFSNFKGELSGNSKLEIAIGLANFHDSYFPLAEKFANLYGVETEAVIQKVSCINIVNPTAELFELAAKKIFEGAKNIAYFPKFSHKVY